MVLEKRIEELEKVAQKSPPATEILVEFVDPETFGVVRTLRTRSGTEKNPGGPLGEIYVTD